MNLKQLEYEPHEAAALLPPLSEDRFARLKADIKANGQQRAIQIQRGRIVDGWHRFRACMELGIEPTVIEYLGDPYKLVAADALRRDLNASQRTMLFRKLHKLEIERQRRAGRDRKRAGQQSGGRGRKKLGGTSSPKKTAAILAKDAGVSEATMKQGAFVERHATPEQIAAIEKGEASLKAVERQIREREQPYKATNAVCPTCGRPWTGKNAQV